MDIAHFTALKAKALGPAGDAWVGALPALVAELASEWQITVGDPYPDGSASYVTRATMADGRDAVLKLAMPDGLDGQGEWARELRAIELGQGRGYADLYACDTGRRAMLLELLGRPLVETSLSIEQQIDVIAATIAPTWQRDPSSVPWFTGAEQAEALADAVRHDWENCGRPCPERVIEQTERFARRRRDAFDPASAIVIHGDAHSWNVLEADAGGYKVIDPDAMLSHPAHDVAIPIRHWNDELLADPEPATRVRAWCARLEGSTGAPADDIWEWAFVERVSTGLFILRLGDDTGRHYLTIADALVRD